VVNHAPAYTKPMNMNLKYHVFGWMTVDCYAT